MGGFYMMEAITTGTAVATSGEQHKWRPNRNTSLYGASHRSMGHHGPDATGINHHRSWVSANMVAPAPDSPLPD